MNNDDENSAEAEVYVTLYHFWMVKVIFVVKWHNFEGGN